MKRIGWSLLLLGAALLTAGCPKPNAGQPQDEVISIPETDDGEKVTGAVGRALLKGVTEAPAPQKPDNSAPSNP